MDIIANFIQVLSLAFKVLLKSLNSYPTIQSASWCGPNLLF